MDNMDKNAPKKGRALLLAVIAAVLVCALLCILFVTMRDGQNGETSPSEETTVDTRITVAESDNIGYDIFD